MSKRVLFLMLLFVVFSGSGLGTFYGLRYWQSLESRASVNDKFAGSVVLQEVNRSVTVERKEPKRIRYERATPVQMASFSG